MRIFYTFPFKTPVLLEDHWPIPLLGGTCRVLDADGKAIAIEVGFTGKPVSLAPEVKKRSEGKIKLDIVDRDIFLPVVQRHLESAFAYLQCYFNVELGLDEVDVRYEGENTDEEARIDLFQFKMGEHESALPLTFDFITRAIMAAEKGPDPSFEATLVTAARTSLFHQKYVDSFRYSFLLIEAIYGAGKFRKKGLQDALKASVELIEYIEAALKEPTPPRGKRQSETSRLLSRSPSASAIIDHLVERRGFYFHGNRERKDSWHPREQESAEALALLAVDIVQRISQQSADRLFAEELAGRHFKDAERAGAIIVLNVKFSFQEPEEGFIRDHQLDIRVPGTRATPKMAFGVLQEFLKRFEWNAPVASLLSAQCVVKATGEKVFDITMHVRPPHAPDKQPSAGD